MSGVARAPRKAPPCIARAAIADSRSSLVARSEEAEPPEPAHHAPVGEPHWLRNGPATRSPSTR